MSDGFRLIRQPLKLDLYTSRRELGTRSGNPLWSLFSGYENTSIPKNVGEMAPVGIEESSIRPVGINLVFPFHPPKAPQGLLPASAHACRSVHSLPATFLFATVLVHSISQDVELRCFICFLVCYERRSACSAPRSDYRRLAHRSPSPRMHLVCIR